MGERRSEKRMEWVVVDDWADLDIVEQYEVISEGTKYALDSERHLLLPTANNPLILDIFDRISGDYIGSVKVIEIAITKKYISELGLE
ncbi:MAG: hypothetical protein DRN81_03935 [Thermoproteota archaeon]|nr:MAG: hypothetical protein DRN81_03935 [Candidatus Korarchaeota archaeon]